MASESSISTVSAEQRMSNSCDDYSSECSLDELEEPSTRAGSAVLDLLSQAGHKFQSTIPDAVTERLMLTSGCVSSDPKITKMVSLAALTFMSVVAKDTLQHYKMRGAPQSGKPKGKDAEARNVLTMEDLTACLDEHGIAVRKPTYFA